MQSLITVFLVAVGLSMDAFSLAVIYGTLSLSKKRIILLSGIVGVFHFFMPLLGNILGSLISNIIKINLDIVVGLILIAIAVEMIISLFKNEEVKSLVGLSSLLLFGFTVSIDSFSVGIGLSVLYSNVLLSVIIFSFVSFLFTFIGLLIGKKLSDIFGYIATTIGSIILLVLGIGYIF